MKAQCSERNALLEKMWSVIRLRVLADDPTKTAEERQTQPDTFAAMKAVSIHEHECGTCKRQSADELCEEGEHLAAKFLDVARGALQKSELSVESINQARVNEALCDFQRHQRHCPVCQ